MASLKNLSVIAALSGQGLTVEESAALEVGMRRRSNEEGLTCWYWGKITGTDNDYLVVIGHGPGKGCVSKKFFFWYACRPACCTPQLPCCCGCDAAIWQHCSLLFRALLLRIATAHQTTSCCKRCRRCLRCVLRRV